MRNELRMASKRKVIGQHQLTSTTSYNRYPHIFRFVKSLSHSNDNLKILSFGCSTGEECFSIRSYFPYAQITGADINVDNLKKAIKRNSDSKTQFVISEVDLLKSKGPFDIIFAMSVLCRWEDTKDLENCASVYPFSKFESTINDLYSILKHDGLLIVYNANFIIEETNVSKFLMPLDLNDISESGFVHKFDKTNNRNLEIHNTVVYRNCKFENFT